MTDFKTLAQTRRSHRKFTTDRPHVTHIEKPAHLAVCRRR